MTAQEIFDTVAKHLLTQNQKCVKDMVCQYRHNGLKCAVGCLISDEDYRPEIEGFNIETILQLEDKESNAYQILCKIGLIHTNLLKSLQFIHDYMEVKSWKSELSKLASKLSLSDSVLKEFDND